MIEIIGSSSEEEMIANFLMAELKSSRFKQSVTRSLKTLGNVVEIINNPNLVDKEENTARKYILMNYRGNYFKGFPQDVSWSKGNLGMGDIGALKTINFNYWLEFSSYTRRITTVAQKVKQDIQYKDEKNDIFFQIAHSQEQLTANPIILVGQDLEALVVLEGHFRLVALLLQEVPPQMVPAIIGLSENISEWTLY